MSRSTLAGKFFWITGAGSGMGREIALQLASAGCTVFISGRRAEPLNALVAQYPENLIAVPADVTDPHALQNAMAKITPITPCLDGVILSAGICEYIDMPDLAPQRIRQVMEVNFHGVVNAVQAALPLLQAASDDGKRGRPELIGIGSMSSYIGFPRAQAYGSSKAAMAYLLESLRCDLGKWLTVTVVYPGFVETPLTSSNDFPMPFLMSAEDAARHIVSRLGRGHRIMRFPWQLHWVLTMARWLPGLWYGTVVSKLSRQGDVGV